MLGLDLEHDRLLDLVEGLEKPEQSLGPDDAVTHGLLTPTISVEVVEHLEMIVVEQQIGIGFACSKASSSLPAALKAARTSASTARFASSSAVMSIPMPKMEPLIGHHLGRQEVDRTVLRVRGDLFQDEGVVLSLELCHPVARASSSWLSDHPVMRSAWRCGRSAFRRARERPSSLRHCLLFRTASMIWNLACSTMI